MATPRRTPWLFATINNCKSYTHITTLFAFRLETGPGSVVLDEAAAVLDPVRALRVHQAEPNSGADGQAPYVQEGESL